MVSVDERNPQLLTGSTSNIKVNATFYNWYIDDESYVLNVKSRSLNMSYSYMIRAISGVSLSISNESDALWQRHTAFNYNT